MWSDVWFFLNEHTNKCCKRIYSHQSQNLEWQDNFHFPLRSLIDLPFSGTHIDFNFLPTFFLLLDIHKTLTLNVLSILSVPLHLKKETFKQWLTISTPRCQFLPYPRKGWDENLTIRFKEKEETDLLGLVSMHQSEAVWLQQNKVGWAGGLEIKRDNLGALATILTLGLLAGFPHLRWNAINFQNMRHTQVPMQVQKHILSPNPNYSCVICHLKWYPFLPFFLRADKQESAV